MAGKSRRKRGKEKKRKEKKKMLFTLYAGFIRLSGAFSRIKGSSVSDRRMAITYCLFCPLVYATVALFVATHVRQRIQLQKHRSTIRTNRGSGVAVFEGSPIRYNIAIVLHVLLFRNTCIYILVIFSGKKKHYRKPLEHM